MRIIEYDDLREREWRTYVDAHPDSTIFHSIAWKKIVEQTYALKPEYRMILEDGVVTGVLPFFRAPGLNLRWKLLSLPFAPYAGPLLTHPTPIEQICDSAGWRGDHVVVRSLGDPDVDAADLVTMILELPGDPDTLWCSLPKDVRKNVRRASKNGMSFTTAGDQDSFMEIYRINMKRFGTPIHRKAFFRNVVELLPEHSAIWAIVKGTSVIGAQLVLWHRDTICLYTGFTRPEYNRSGAAVLLAWETMKQAIGMGLSRLDHGRSTKGTGPYTFKLRWGAKPVPLRYSEIHDGLVTPSDMPRPGQLARLWSCLPMPITDCLGPVLRRFIA